MSKKSIICAILALSMIFMGTGYAYWTDTLNVTTKATTGDFDVAFVDLGLYAQYEMEQHGDYWSIVDGIGVDGCIPASYFARGLGDVNSIARGDTIQEYYSYTKGYNSVRFDAGLVEPEKINKTVGPYAQGIVNGSDNIVIDVDNMYPGYAMTFRSDIINLGSIAARLSTIKFEVSGLGGEIAINDTTKNMLGIAVMIENEYQEPGVAGDDAVFLMCKELGFDDDMIFTVGNVHFLRLSALEQLTYNITTDKEYHTILTLPSENRMDFYIGIAMDPDAEGVYTSGSTEVLSGKDDSLSQNTGAKISVTLLWDQFNTGVEVDKSTHLSEQNHTYEVIN